MQEQPVLRDDDSLPRPAALFERGGEAIRCGGTAEAAPRDIFEALPGLSATRWAAAWARIASGGTDSISAIDDSGRDVLVRVRALDLGGRRVALVEASGSSAIDEAELTALQQRVLSGVAAGRGLATIMDRLCREVEAMRPGVIASVLSVDATGRLRHIASPSLPRDYSESIDGLPIGPCVGSCGTAAFHGRPIEVTDIANDPLWAPARDLALAAGVRACWSSPIKAGDGRVVGTFAFYWRDCRGPDPADRRIVAACLALASIAIEHEEASNRVHEIAQRDFLTGLPNRLGLQRGANDAIVRHARLGRGLALHFLDIDGFKLINDAHGHHAGDRVLEVVASRLAGELRFGESVARLGGDEFAVIQPDVDDDGAVEELAARLLAAVAEPIAVDGRCIEVSACLGAARYPRDGGDIAELLKNADVAVYRAKRNGRGRWCLFNGAMAESIRAERLLERDLAEAIEAERIEVHFQPIVAIGAERIVGFEALARWQHPRRGSVPPSEFIEIAERAGLIAGLGELVLRKACREAARWPGDIGVSVNLSPSQLVEPDFVFKVVRAVREAGMAPARLDLEITETVPLSENSAVRTTLEQLRAFGASISLDDFGVGYSSLSYLRSFPFDRIKIDMSFVRDIGRRADAEAILKAAIGLGGALGMHTTAEGVETEFQRDWLLAQGCAEGQGYLFSRPLPADEALALVSRGAQRLRA